MPKANLFNMAGDHVGEVTLSEAVFGVEPNKSVLHDSVKNHLANCRQGTQSALTKGEVSYTTAKPWRQKGTGRARAGYKGSPVWTHGGVAFAPKPRDYSYTLNKKVKRLALKSALSAKAAEEKILVIDGLAVEEIKTAPFKAFLDKIGVDGKALVITENVDEKVVKSARNIPGVTTTTATILSPYAILNNRHTTSFSARSSPSSPWKTSTSKSMSLKSPSTPARSRSRRRSKRSSTSRSSK